jgi:hypothetical protein
VRASRAITAARGLVRPGRRLQPHPAPAESAGPAARRAEAFEAFEALMRQGAARQTRQRHGRLRVALRAMAPVATVAAMA